MSISTSKVLSIDGSAVTVRFEGPLVILEDRKVSVPIHRSRLPDVIALLEAARDELLNDRAASQRGRA